MKTSVIKIGNSKGIRIPKTLLTACSIKDEVDLLVEQNKIVIVPYKDKPRSNWESRFEEMSLQKEDSLLIPDSIDLNASEWEW